MTRPRTLLNVLGSAVALTGSLLFLYGLFAFAATRGQSLESFGAVLLGYGSLLMGVYTSPGLRLGTENGISALRRLADRFFDF